MSDTWTIQAALDWTEGYLERKGDENPRLSAQWLLSDATKLSRIELYTQFERPLTMEERDILRGYVARRGAGEPLQYITGEVGFRHITIGVRPGVLIPRPETEVLVSEALALLPAMKRDGAYLASDPRTGDSPLFSGEGGGPPLTGQVLVADLCTGSGCVACSLAYEYPSAHVVATDISPEAVALASENVERLQLADRVEVLECSLGEGIPASRSRSFDIVVSNPPYIPTALMSEIPEEVAGFEPHLALDGGADGLELFRPLAAWAHDALKPGAALVVELHEGCLDAAAQVARDSGYERIRIVDDLAGRPRVLVAHAPSGE